MGQALNRTELPLRFEPRFWEEADGRCALVRAIRKRYDRLLEDSGADSIQKELLCQRAVFLSLQLETMEVRATEQGAFDSGVYTQMTNSLMGLLRTLGLQRHIKSVPDLKEYLESRE